MASNTHSLIFIYLSACVLLSFGLEFRYLRYCGPPDRTFKYKITPWPELKPGQPANVTISFTPSVDIFSSTLQYEVISKSGGQIFSRGTRNIQCSEVPQICNLAAGETVTLSYKCNRLRTFPLGLKGTYYAKIELYNQDQVMWLCLEAEGVL